MAFKKITKLEINNLNKPDINHLNSTFQPVFFLFCFFVNPPQCKSSFEMEQVGAKYIGLHCKPADCDVGLLLSLSMTDFGAQTHD